MHKKKYRRCRSIVFFILCSFMSVSNPFELNASLAKTQFSVSKDELIKVYQERAFSNDTGTIIKPSNGYTFNIGVQCVSADTCDGAVSILGSYLKASWVKPKQVDKFDDGAPIHVLFFADAAADQQRFGQNQNLKFPAGTKSIKSGDDNCNVVSFYKENTVERVLISVNKKLPERELAACVLIEISQAIALFVEPEFRSPTDVNGALYRDGNDMTDRILIGFARLIAMQLSSYTHPGMTKADFEAVVADKNLTDLLGVDFND